MRVFFAALLILSLAFALPPASRADDAQSLLAKHKAFVGWQFGDGTFTAFDMEREGTTAAGTVVGRSVEHRVALVYRRDSGKGNASGFTGKIFWGTNRNGFTVPYIGDEAERLLATDVLFMEGTSELPAEMRGTTSVDGQTYPVVRVTMNGAKPIDLAVDPKTGAYVKATIDPDGASQSLRILSYQTIAGGKKMIGSWSRDGKTSYRYTKVVVNPPLRDDNFRPPAPQATWNFANGAACPITVTDKNIYFDAKVNGVAGTFLFDTGAAGMYLTDDFANRAQIKTVGHSRAEGIGGEIKTLVRHADTFEIGGNTLSNVIVETSNETSRVGKFNQQIDGYIGFDLLAGARVTLNIAAKTMALGPDDEAVEAPAGGYLVNVDLSSKQPALPIRLDDKFTVDAVMDTGAAASGTMISSKVRDHGIVMVSSLRAQGGANGSSEGFLGGNRTFVGAGGETVRVLCGSLDKVVIGPFVYQNNSVCESPTMELHDGLLGYDFMKNFDYIFDYHHGRIVMIPHHDGN